MPRTQLRSARALAFWAWNGVWPYAWPVLWWLGLLALMLTAVQAYAGVLKRDDVQRAFPAPISVGERDRDLPLWPLFKQNGTETALVGYVFESIDLAPVPGFSGTPMNLMVAIDPQGRFLNVKVLSHHEPVFLDGLGEEPMFRFVEQYRGLSLKQNIKIGSNQNRAGQLGSANVYIDGVAKATASVRILNQSLLASAVKVARAKLGYAAGRDPELIARVRQDVYQASDWAGLIQQGLVQQVQIRNAEVEAAFRGTAGQDQDDEARAHPQDVFSEISVAWLSAPAVGRNLLKPAGWRHLLSRIDEGDHALLVLARGRYSFVGNDFTRGAVPDRLTLHQGDLPIEIRDLDLDDPLQLPSDWRRADAKVFRVIGAAGLDPAQALNLALRVTRSKGIVYPERVSRDFPIRYQLPDELVLHPQGDNKTWRTIWSARWWELAVLGVALAVLSALLWQQHRLAASQTRLMAVRLGFAAFTLGFIGWYAQGQLSIVNLTALVQALVAGRGLGFFLYDPMTVVLWAFVLLTLVFWGRGTFCGWLCPFGALQEIVWRAARAIRLPTWRLHRDTDRRAKRLKYAVLLSILALAGASAVPALSASARWADAAIEVEPFKTAITLGFVRSWPFVLWAVGLVGVNALLYKSYCRYLCPLGAGLALLSRVRRVLGLGGFGWIARRAECGQPCQTCRHRCDYQAIAPSGAVQYDECFQCLDCVAIHDSPSRCAPLIQQARQTRVIPIQEVPA